MVAPRLTLRELAADLGVSRATVSNAYNRPDQLSAGLRERILARARELGFAGPDPVARGLRRGRVGAVGVLVDQGLSYVFSDPVAVLVLDGLARELEADGYGLLLHAAVPGQLEAPLVRAAAVDAWVLASVPSGHPAVEAAQAQSRPLVVMDQPALPGVPVVTIDDAGGARAATRHLLDLGHRRIGVLTVSLRGDRLSGPADLARQGQVTYDVMARRLSAVTGAAVAAGIGWAQVPVVECAASDVDAGADGARQVLASGVTGIVALTDQLALGVLRVARDEGIAVPEQLSVVGFDDVPAARSAAPPLTTVAQPLLERGEALGRLLRAMLRGEQVTSPPPFPTHLVVRGSTGPPPVGRH